MKLIAPTNWDNKLIDKIKGLPVEILYAKLKRDSIGGGRPAIALPDVTKKQAENHIQKAHDAGLKFNYVLNATCLSNNEFLKSYQNKILKEIEWICSQNVEYVTISIPYLMELVKKNFPQLKIIASVFLNIDSIQKALFYQKFGVSEIVPDQSQNRNFIFLQKLRKTIDIDLQLVVNNICLIFCPFRLYHQNINSHASQYNSGQTKKISDLYVTLSCESIRINHPEEIIKSPWIRPEDLEYYEKIGINRFKISGRTKKTDWIVKVIKSYADRKSPENFAEILSYPIPENLPRVNLEINNKNLKNFLKGFAGKDCRNLECLKCKYCYKIADKTVKMNTDNTNRVTKKYLKILNNLAY